MYLLQIRGTAVLASERQKARSPGKKGTLDSLHYPGCMRLGSHHRVG